MFLSIIVPVYNGEKTIARALNSILEQTSNNFEVIVINDGSTDGTTEILAKYELLFEKANRKIKTIYQKNHGVSFARNRGLVEVIGDYVSFLDSDDYLKNNMVEALLNYSNMNNFDYMIYGFYSLENHEEKKFDNYNSIFIKGKSNLKEKLNELLPTRILNSPCNKLYKTNLLEKYLIKFDHYLDLGEDLNFNLLYYFKINNLYIVDDRLYVIDHENSYLSVKYRENYFESRLNALRLMKKTFTENTMNLEVFNWLYIKLVYACIFEMFRSEEKKTKAEMNQYLTKILSESEIKEAIQNFESKNSYHKILITILKLKHNSLIILCAYVFNKFKAFAPMSLRKLSV